MADVDASVLARFPGAPFSQEEVDAAVAAIRVSAGWRIAPVAGEQIVMDVHPGWSTLILPTRRLLAVESITDADTGVLIDPSTYRVSLDLGQVQRLRGWPEGYGRVLVSFRHGFDTFPTDLLGVVADGALAVRGSTSTTVQVDDAQFTVGGAAASASTHPLGTLASLDAYSLYGSRSTYGMGFA